MSNAAPPTSRLKNGKELAYMIVLPLALTAISSKKRRLIKSNASAIYERLLSLKNSLDDLFIQTKNKNSEEYSHQLYQKILTEKLILNIASGKTSDIKQNLEQVMKEEGLSFIEREESLISAEEKFLIKTDFQGFSHYPSREMLSSFFQECIEKRQNPENKPIQASPNDYDIEKIPSWKYFKQFPSFAEREDAFKKAIIDFNISPQDINKLNAYDIIAMLRNYSVKNNLPIIENAKMKFIKFFIKHHEEEFRNYYQSNKAVILQACRNKGIELNLEGNPNAYQDFIEKSISQMKEFGYVPPLFNIHHKCPVKDCRSENNLSLANHPSNLCLILQSPYHNMLHLFDTNSSGKTIFNKKVKRVSLPEDIIFFGGFDKNFQINHHKEAEYAPALLAFINMQKQR